MDILTPAHKSFLIELLNSGVNFMLIGGYAVNFHGYPRYTSDMDIWLQPDNENKLKFAQLLRQKKIREDGINLILNLDFTKAQAFHIGSDESRIDFWTLISGVQYAEANIEKVFIPLEDKMIGVIQFHHLIKNKNRSARLKDLADVEELQKINQFKI